MWKVSSRIAALALIAVALPLIVPAHVLGRGGSVLIPVFALGAQGQLGGFNTSGLVTATIAGALGAAGAACIIWAFRTGGLPVYVMPLVFGGAPIVNVLLLSVTDPKPGLGNYAKIFESDTVASLIWRTSSSSMLFAFCGATGSKAQWP